MQLIILMLILCSCWLTGCNSQAEQLQEKITEVAVPENLVNQNGRTVAERFRTPAGFTRLAYEADAFGSYLRHFQLKPHGTAVLYYNGTVKSNDRIYEAVLDIDVGKQDLQQCADAVMRLRAEYLYRNKRYPEIHFNFTNGFRADYSSWQQGKRIKVQGNECSWVQKAAPASDYRTFRAYLQQVFMYAGTLSLEKELTPVSAEAIQAGDVFIKGGSPGHAVIVMDVAENDATGERIFLLAQSYMPAQDIHILCNNTDSGKSPWYSNRFGQQLFTPEWTFSRNQLRRF